MPLHKHGSLHAISALGIKVRESFWMHSHVALQIPRATAYMSDYYIQIKFKRECRVNICRQTCDQPVGALPPLSEQGMLIVMESLGTCGKQPVSDEEACASLPFSLL